MEFDEKTKRILDTIEEQTEWGIHISEKEKEVEIYIETWSPAGEDLVEYLSFDGTPKSLIKSIRDMWDNFDVDEHVEMWIGAKDSVSGVPQSIRVLVEDAEAIDKMYEELYDLVHELA